MFVVSDATSNASMRLHGQLQAKWVRSGSMSNMEAYQFLGKNIDIQFPEHLFVTHRIVEQAKTIYYCNVLSVYAGLLGLCGYTLVE